MSYSNKVSESSAATRLFVSVALVWMWSACSDDQDDFAGDGSVEPSVDSCETPSADAPPEILDNTRLTADEVRQFFRESQGSELFPVDWLLALRKEGGEPFFIPERPGFGLLVDTDRTSNLHGLPIGMTSSPAHGDGLEDIDMFGFNCAACHVGEVRAENKVYRIIGAPSMFDINAFRIQFAETLGSTIASPERVSQFVAELAKNDSHTLAASRSVVGADPTDTTAAGRARMLEAFLAHFREPLRVFVAKQFAPTKPPPAYTAAGPGRADAFGTAHNLFFPDDPWPLTAPVDYPRLWNLSLMERYHWDGNTSSTLQRNVGQAIGLGAKFDPDTFESTARFDTLVKFEALIRKIDPPRWPFALPDASLVGRGFEIYRSRCAQCHSRESGVSDPDVGTDPNRATSFAGITARGPFYEVLENTMKNVIEKAGIASREYDYADEGAVWSAPGTYQTRTLAGIWASAPYLHNGSVPTLAALLSPSQRPAEFDAGGHQLDLANVGYCKPANVEPRMKREASKPGNGVAGHDYGSELKPHDKRALIAYLRTL